MRASAPCAACRSAITSTSRRRSASRRPRSTFLSQVEEAWSLTDPAIELLLRWAARLHEIGLDVAHSGYHRHGAYLLANADMAGFPREEQKLLSIMVGSHRRKPAIEEADDLMPPWDKRAPGNDPDAAPRRAPASRPQQRRAAGRSGWRRARTRWKCGFRRDWLDDHPLTVADLQVEIEHLKSVGFRLRVFTVQVAVSGAQGTTIGALPAA